MEQLKNDDWLYIASMIECHDELTQEMEQLKNDDWFYIASMIECHDELVYMREHKRRNS